VPVAVVRHWWNFHHCILSSHSSTHLVACKAVQHSAILRRFHILDRPPLSLCSLAGSVGDKNGRNIDQKPYQLHLHITAGPGHLLILMIYMMSAQTRQQHAPQHTSTIYVISHCLDGEVQQVRGRTGGQQTATGVLFASYIPIARFPTGPNSPISNRLTWKLYSIYSIKSRKPGKETPAQ